MATNISLASLSTRNPALKLTTSSDRELRAKEGCIGEWDMLTFDAGDNKKLLDLSGNANHFNFISAPTLVTAGLTTDSGGVNYADMVLASPLVDNYSILFVGRGDASSNTAYMAGTFNNTALDGVFWGPTTNFGLLAYLDSTSRTASAQPTSSGYPSAATVSAAPYPYPSQIFTVQKRFIRNRPTSGGRLLNHIGINKGTGAGRSRWRLGGVAQTVGGDDAVYYQKPGLPACTFTFAYMMLFNKVKDYEEGFCLHEYIKAKMAARGVTIV